MPILALVLAGPKEAPSLAELLAQAGCTTRTAVSLPEVKELLGSFPARLAVAEWPVLLKDPNLLVSLRKLCDGLKVILIAPPNMLVEAREFLKEHDTLLPLPLDADSLKSAVSRSQGGMVAAVLGALLAMPTKFMARAKARTTAQSTSVAERARARVFEGFHQAMAGKLIVATAGLDLWDRIAELEPHWARMKADEDTPPAAYVALAARYEQVFAHMAAVAQSGTTGSMRKRQPDEVDLACVQGLFERVREGVVTPEHLQQAWRVWNLPADQREQNELFKLLWMSKRRKSGSSQKLKKVGPGGEKAADLIQVPTESQKIKRTKGSSESQKGRAKKSGESQGMKKQKAEPPAAAATPGLAAPAQASAAPWPLEDDEPAAVAPPPGQIVGLAAPPAQIMALGAPVATSPAEGASAEPAPASADAVAAEAPTPAATPPEAPPAEPVLVDLMARPEPEPFDLIAGPAPEPVDLTAAPEELAERLSTLTPMELVELLAGPSEELLTGPALEQPDDLFAGPGDQPAEPFAAPAQPEAIASQPGSEVASEQGNDTASQPMAEAPPANEPVVAKAPAPAEEAASETAGAPEPAPAKAAPAKTASPAEAAEPAAVSAVAAPAKTSSGKVRKVKPPSWNKPA